MPLHLPPDVDRAWLAPLTDVVRHRGEWVPTYEVDGQYRRAITRNSPVMFALVYLGGLLSSRETGWRTSLAALHLRIGARLRRWRLGAVRAPRDAVIAPRGGAKSTWGLVIGPLWALAHEHREFVLGLSDSTEQIRLHMGAARAQLAGNRWLAADYPDLQPWAGAQGRRGGRTDSALTYISRSGRALAGRSTRARTLGIRAIAARPDAFVLDDLEPEGARYSERAQAQLLDIVLHKILPMNESAAVLWLGTTTRYGSLAHQLVRAAAGRPADWIVDERFEVLHESPLTPAGESFWVQRYSRAYLESIAHTRNYALNFANDPPEPGGEHWTEATFRRAARRELGPLTMSIDPATTVTDTSDYTAFVVGGRTGGIVQVLYARAWRLTSTQIRERAQLIIASNPDIATVILESNVAADWARDVLEPVDPRTRQRIPLARGVRVDTYSSSGSKAGRIAKLLDHYEGTTGLQVEHVGQLGELETQAKHWPAVEHDDLIDADAALVEHLAGHVASAT